MDIGDKIKSRRNELGFTLKEVADKLGVRDATAAEDEDRRHGFHAGRIRGPDGPLRRIFEGVMKW